MTKVKILFFASAKEVVNTSSCVLDLKSTSDGANSFLSSSSNTSHSLSMETSSSTYSLSDVRQALMKNFPVLTPLMNRISLSYNMKYVRRQDEEKVQVHDQDEIALIPPISGG